MIVAFSSCEKVIDFDGKIPEPLMVVNCIVSPDSLISVHVTKSRFFLSNSYEFENVEDAKVVLVLNDSLQEELEHIGNGIYESKFIPKPNDKIHIYVQSAGLKETESTLIVQPKIDIISVDTTWVKIEYVNPIYDGLNNEIGTRKFIKVNVKIRFKDDDNEKNYYQLFVQKKITEYFKINNGEIFEQQLYNQWDIEYDDVVFGNTQSESDIFGQSSSNINRSFNDDLFNGKEYTLSFSTITSVSEYDEGKVPDYKPASREDLEITLNHLTKDYYLYILTANAAMNVDIFTEPVQIYSNINNGLGIFGNCTPVFTSFYLGEYNMSNYVY